MKIILLQDEKKLGKKGQVIEASDGFARNYILPKKIGVEATPKNMNELKLQKANADKIAAEQLAAAQELAAKIGKLSVTAYVKTGEGGRSFGSVSSKEIAQAALDQHQIELDKKKIVLPDPLKNVGSYDVTIKLHPQVSAKLKVLVEAAN